jgi:hypothetical protein
MGCAQPDDRGWRPRARPRWEHGMVAGLTSNHHPNPLPPISALTCRNQGAFLRGFVTSITSQPELQQSACLARQP